MPLLPTRRLPYLFTLLALVAAPMPARAQVIFRYDIGVGMLAPLGTLNRTYKAGMHGFGGFELGLEGLPNLSLRVDVSGARIRTDSVGAGRLRVIGLGANLMYVLHTDSYRSISPYVLGGAGFYSVNTSATSGTTTTTASLTRIGFTAGGGLLFRLDDQTHFFFEGRLLHFKTGDPDANGLAGNYNALPVLIGIRWRH